MLQLALVAVSLFESCMTWCVQEGEGLSSGERSGADSCLTTLQMDYEDSEDEGEEEGTTINVL